jgi:hypothetical protein
VGLDEFIAGGMSLQVMNGGQIFPHDMQVKKIDGEWMMMVSYWDVGWVLLNVDDPTNPTFVDDYDYPDPDPLTGFSPPEGNAHQSWWSKDNRFVLGTDEDFAPSRIDTMETTTGPNAGPYPAAAVGGGTGPDTLPDGRMNGPTVYGGYGCDASAPVPLRSDYDLELGAGEEAIIVLQRGPEQDPGAPEVACFPGEKSENGINAGLGRSAAGQPPHGECRHRRTILWFGRLSGRPHSDGLRHARGLPPDLQHRASA